MLETSSQRAPAWWWLVTPAVVDPACLAVFCVVHHFKNVHSARRFHEVKLAGGISKLKIAGASQSLTEANEDNEIEDMSRKRWVDVPR